jgi:putative ABC transport system permease protein
MLNVTVKGLWAQKRRLISTTLAVVLGVAFLTGTLVLGDTMRATFDDLFSNVNRGTDTVVRAERIGTADDTASTRLIDESIVSEVRSIPGVAAAEPFINGYGQLIGTDHKPIGGRGPPTIAGNWVRNAKLNPFELASGRLPQADDEVVVNRGAAKDGKFGVGDTITLQTPAPVKVKVVGLSTFGNLDSAGGATFTAFTLEGAQKLVTHQPARISSVRVAAAPGVSQAQLVHRISPHLPEGTEAITGQALTAENNQSINNDFLGFLSAFLVVFAGIALLVATFSTYNTFSIIVAQRTRESALLRALGASRRQVMLATVGEALVIGIVASVLGLAVGFGIAAGLKSLLGLLGGNLPNGALIFKPATAIIGVTMGVVVTVVAGVMPARRASRIPPLAALRDVAFEATTASRVRIGIGTLVTGLGTAMVLGALTMHGGKVLSVSGLGSLLMVIGVVVIGPVVARPVSALLGAPAARTRGMAGRLARRNAMRNPRRTSGTASALMIGVAVVTLFTVFAASIKASISDTLDRSFPGDLVLQAGGNFGSGGISPELATKLGRLPEVRAASGLANAEIRLDGEDTDPGVIDPATMNQVLDLDVRQGSIGKLRADQIAVNETKAEAEGWHLGTTVPIVYPDGVRDRVSVGAIYADSDLAGNLLLTQRGWAPHVVQNLDVVVLVRLAQGVSLDDGRAAVERAAKPFAGVDIQDRKQYEHSVGSGVNQLLGFVYVLLLLAIVIALMGIANTLSLSIHERTRELGLLRAVGSTRRQIRSMVRWESVIIALFGTVGGLGLGAFLGWALVKAASNGGIGTFSAAPNQLAVVFVVGALAGVIAAIRPARKASRLDMLRAVASE